MNDISKKLNLTLQKIGGFCLYGLLIVGVIYSPNTQAERLKDIATIQGVRSNQLLGYGLVVGLDGTGDQTTQTPFTVQSI
ncbi:MAG TPA: flagellar basal body P-ring protein FlgI, partial [Methylotenera sp.]|nr:flagellar basal body P-ring protein FlgI [Methylotenera sp.]